MNTHPIALMLLTFWLIILAMGVYASIFIDLTAGIAICLFAALFSVIVIPIVFPPMCSIYGAS